MEHASPVIRLLTSAATVFRRFVFSRINPPEYGPWLFSKNNFKNQGLRIKRFCNGKRKSLNGASLRG
jgi:hypothetical protein